MVENRKGWFAWETVNQNNHAVLCRFTKSCSNNSCIPRVIVIKKTNKKTLYHQCSGCYVIPSLMQMSVSMTNSVVTKILIVSTRAMLSLDVVVIQEFWFSPMLNFWASEKGRPIVWKFHLLFYFGGSSFALDYIANFRPCFLECSMSSLNQKVDWTPSEVNVTFGQYKKTSHWYANISWTPLNGE